MVYTQKNISYTSLTLYDIQNHDLIPKMQIFDKKCKIWLLFLKISFLNLNFAPKTNDWSSNNSPGLEYFSYRLNFRLSSHNRLLA